MPLGAVLSDAMRFMDLAAGEERSYEHPSGYELHAMDICVEFAKAVGVEPCSPEYYAAIKRLEDSSPPLISAAPHPTPRAGETEEAGG